jgi:F1F0 ATPase subunit 2
VTALHLAAGAAAGIIAGLVMFGGLAATVARLPGHPHPARLMVASLLGRAAVVAVLLVVAARLGPAPLVLALVAVLAVRTVLVRRAATATRRPDVAGGEPWT